MPHWCLDQAAGGVLERSGCPLIRYLRSAPKGFKRRGDFEANSEYIGAPITVVSAERKRALRSWWDPRSPNTAWLGVLQSPPAGIGVDRARGSPTDKRAERVHPRVPGGFSQVGGIREFSTDRTFNENHWWHGENKRVAGTSDSTCPLCHAPLCSQTHILCVCPSLDHIRKEQLSSIRSATNQPSTARSPTATRQHLY